MAANHLAGCVLASHSLAYALEWILPHKRPFELVPQGFSFPCSMGIHSFFRLMFHSIVATSLRCFLGTILPFRTSPRSQWESNPNPKLARTPVTTISRQFNPIQCSVAVSTLRVCHHFYFSRVCNIVFLHSVFSDLHHANDNLSGNIGSSDPGLDYTQP